MRTKGEKIKYAIAKQCQEYSLKEWCENWDITIDEFYEFLDLGVEAFDGMHGIAVQDPHWILFDKDYWSDRFDISEMIWATDDGVPRAKSFRITPIKVKTEVSGNQEIAIDIGGKKE